MKRGSQQARQHLQDVVVPLVVLPKRMLATSEAEVRKHGVAEDISGVALARMAAAACYELLRGLPTAAASCSAQTPQCFVLSLTSSCVLIPVFPVQAEQENSICNPLLAYSQRLQSSKTRI